jgi:hypothetical protein
MKQFFTTYKTQIYTHLTAFIVGGVISFLIFTSSNYEKVNDKEIEIEKQIAVTEELTKDLTPTIDFETELNAKEQELQTVYEINEKLKKDLQNEKSKKISDVKHLSDEQLFRFIAEWAKRNGSLPQ